jgi:hypothetical protein
MSDLPDDLARSQPVGKASAHDPVVYPVELSGDLSTAAETVSPHRDAVLPQRPPPSLCRMRALDDFPCAIKGILP